MIGVLVATTAGAIPTIAPALLVLPERPTLTERELPPVAITPLATQLPPVSPLDAEAVQPGPLAAVPPATVPIISVTQPKTLLATVVAVTVTGVVAAPPTLWLSIGAAAFSPVKKSHEPFTQFGAEPETKARVFAPVAGVSR